MSSYPPTFATTQWSIVASAGRDSTPESRAALAALCETYWYPLYAYVRRKGHQRAEAQDLTQSFFTELLEKDRLRKADSTRGRFRSFLLASLNHFIANQWRNAHAQKRGGTATRLSLDFDAGESRYQLEPVHSTTPERIFERRWAMTLLDRAMTRLRDEYTASDKEALFDALKSRLGAEPDATSYAEIATRLDTTEAAIKVAAHRLRRRTRELLREEISQTVNDAAEIDDELRDLFSALG